MKNSKKWYSIYMEEGGIMRELKKNFEEYDNSSLSLDFDEIKLMLPYPREYDTLTQEELKQLIHKAKNESWKVLDLSMCGLREIPLEIGLLSDLEVLDLGNDAMFAEFEGDPDPARNFFATLPTEIGCLKNLRGLNLYGTGMNYLPNDFSALTNMEVLNLNGSEFEFFPNEICKLINLKNLAIDSSFSIIPEDIGDLLELERLYLPDSNIRTLPAKIGNLVKLEILYLGRSCITNIPESLANLKQLKEVGFEDTPLSETIPPEIFNQTPSQLIDYILRNQNDNDKVILNESKMIIVGQGGVGKTSLLNRLINNTYIDGASTEGIDIAKWNFEYEEENYELNVWDFGGQEIYHSTHQFFLTERSLYIFVWDARQEEEYGRIDYWLNTIQSFANDSPIIIVVNKCDESRKNVKVIDISDIRLRFPQVIGFHYVSCLDNTNINLLREQIINTSRRLPLMQTAWFSTWINVRNELEKLSKTKNSINYNEFSVICNEYNIEKKEALSLIKYLHDLGVVLYFHKDVLLKNIIILNPEWGTDAVYKILDAQANILKDRNGILYYSDLIKIWDDSINYPESSFPYILKLMENFQLSFTVESDNTFLVPELLENTDKKLPLEFLQDETLNFRYSYSFLPAGIMTRFIVGLHNCLIDYNGSKMCWRKGAYLQYDDAYCLVKLRDGITDRYVEIKVSGKNNRNRRQFLTIVRNTFNQIHKSIPKINFSEKVLCNCTPDCTYLHDFKYLIKLEENGINEERCKKTLKLIDIAKLLDGIELNKERGQVDLAKINISPVFNNNPVINTQAQAYNDNNLTVTIEIKNVINELQGCVNELRDEIGDDNLKIKSDIEKVEEKIQKLDGMTSREDIIKSGTLNQIRRFLEELGDSESTSGKVIGGIKHGYSILQDIAEKYNSIAEWCGV